MTEYFPTVDEVLAPRSGLFSYESAMVTIGGLIGIDFGGLKRVE